MKKIDFLSFKLENKFIITNLLVGIEVVLALLIGLALVAVGAGGGAWILGGIISGALVLYFYRFFYNNQAEPNRNSRKIGQIIVGLTIGFSLKHSNLVALSTQLPIFVLLALFLLLSGGIIGYIYSRIQKTDLLTALLATVPGNIGVMASMAADYGRDTSLVSLVQLIRFTAVILIAPIIANVANSHDINAILLTITNNLFNFNTPYLLLCFLLLLITFLAVYAGKKFKIPVYTFLCSIIVGIFFNFFINLIPLLAQVDFNLPLLVNLIGQALLGITIGEYWGINPKLKDRTIAFASIPVGLTFLAGLISAGIAMVFTDWDWLTCLLVTTPGGSPEMILISLALHRNVEIVTTGHLVRLITINFSLPAFVSLFGNREPYATQDKDSGVVTKLPELSETLISQAIQK